MKRLFWNLKHKKAWLVLLLGTGMILSSCSNIDQSFFRELSVESVEKNTAYNQLPVNSTTFRNLVFGTRSYNDGNYVVVIATETDSSQINFLNGSTNQGTSSLSWGGTLGTTIRQVQNRYSTYPNGVKFLIWNDIAPGSVKWNPYARFPVVDRKNELASQEDKDNSNKLRRSDASAVRYREIVDFIQRTYGGNVANLINQSNVHAQTVGNDVTKAIVIAFRKDNLNKIRANFYGLDNSTNPNAPGSGQGDSTPPASSGEGGGSDGSSGGDSSSGNGQNTTPTSPQSSQPAVQRSQKSYGIKQHAVRVSVDFLNFLDSVYTPLN
ncbi:DUF6856 family protein [Mycoplasmoides genitalium]|uniref:Uncharacterized lipoprotein MG348 n=2 Tax=Mycoplasmoides genitalium TaxID=2097 RepID=Y348_MYCGE|nr:hypothetical protein [Mycoplasmoides genitalium]P47590.1 RecName: Full=Uncharacterized lipoprotein MG348; Flags: Precursor [Mycoplasmoides genitalium G37]ABY79319.1 lipoprotein, putative [synthetic Mycoplasma genitalium JCVI-1.0]AAC71573.1 lipoprotein, putative [Mycoplasmoides genitalium G37]AFQ03190.1 lipoprotein [Mycoplasmoides genitalium M2321]AFQ03675.1 lipoprotein [Mycoplasmoides genitalium M6282]AFQ04180.1 lipoprotein [Mycoplasmoides genitalium M6320]